MMIPNRISLDDLRNLPVGEIAALPSDQLVLLQDEAAEQLRAAKTLGDWLDGAIALKYGDRAQEVRQTEGKDSAATLSRSSAMAGRNRGCSPSAWTTSV